MTPALRQFALQSAAALAVLSLAWPYYGPLAVPLPWLPLSLAIGAIALVFATIARAPWWWRLIHTLFAPLAWAISQLQIAPGWYLFAFLATMLVYRGALTGQVPLYLSNRQTAASLSALLAARGARTFCDLGAGIGSVVRHVAAEQPGLRCTGVENAPLTWSLGRLLTLGMDNCDWRWGSLWQQPLQGFDVVYAFLSPAPMPELWQKIKAEMPAGGLFISNSFPVPDLEPDEVLELDDARGTRLFCYRT